MDKIKLSRSLDVPVLDTIHVRQVVVNYESQEITMSIRLGGFVGVDLIIRNGDSLGLKRNDKPTGVADTARSFALDLADGYDRVLASLGDPSALLAELQALGVVHSSLAGSVVTE